MISLQCIAKVPAAKLIEILIIISFLMQLTEAKIAGAHNSETKEESFYKEYESWEASRRFQLCGRRLNEALHEVCTPIGWSHACFQGGMNRSPTLQKGDEKYYNRSYRRGVATTCCEYRDCTLRYLRTFCCETSFLAN